MVTEKVAIAVRGVSHQFGEAGEQRFVRALLDTSLEVARGELLCLIGPSGCGKSTLLNVIGGLMEPSAGAVDVLQPDVVLAVGMLRTRTIAELALLRHRWFTPHTWTNGLGLLANLHVVAGVGGGPYVEFPYDPPGWTEQRRDFFLAEPVRIDSSGCLRVPDAPGFGVQIDEGAVSHWALPKEKR